MKRLLYILTIITLFNSCSKEETINESEEQLTIINGGIINTSEIVQLEIENLDNNSYSGKINDINVSFSKVDENILAFIVTPNIPLGDVSIDIEELDIQINYTVEKTVLNDSSENVIQEFISDLQESVESIENLEQQERSKKLISSFIEYFNSLSDSEKLTSAEYYQTNKTFLKTAIDGNFNRLESKSVTAFTKRLESKSVTAFTRCQSGIYLTGILGVATSLTTASGFGAIVGIITGTATGITLAQTLVHCIDATTSKVKSIFLKANNSLDAYSKGSNNTFIELNNEVKDKITLSLGNRAIQSSDQNDENENLSNIFNWIDDLNNSIIQNLNSAIEGWNDFTPSFSSIDPFETVEINSNSEITQLKLTKDLFDNLTFSIPSDNVEIQSLEFEDGGINIKLKIKDEDLLSEDYLETTLDFNYRDDFNDFEGSFPLKINVTDFCSDIINTNWRMDLYYGTFENLDGTFVKSYNLTILDTGYIEVDFNNGSIRKYKFYCNENNKYIYTWASSIEGNCATNIFNYDVTTDTMSGEVCSSPNYQSTYYLLERID